MVIPADIMGGEMKHIHFLLPERWHVATGASDEVWVLPCLLHKLPLINREMNTWIPIPRMLPSEECWFHPYSYHDFDNFGYSTADNAISIQEERAADKLK